MKDRAPLSAHQALSEVAGLIGWPAVADIAGRARRTVLNWSDPDTSAQVNHGTAVRLDLAYLAAGGLEPPFLRLHQLHLDLAMAERAADAITRGVRLAEAAREAGEAVASQIHAHLPGAKPADRIVAQRETEQAITALTRTLTDLR